MLVIIKANNILFIDDVWFRGVVWLVLELTEKKVQESASCKRGKEGICQSVLYFYSLEISEGNL
jgi:hypothetical protein